MRIVVDVDQQVFLEIKENSFSKKTIYLFVDVYTLISHTDVYVLVFTMSINR